MTEIAPATPPSPADLSRVAAVGSLASSLTPETASPVAPALEPTGTRVAVSAGPGTRLPVSAGAASELTRALHEHFGYEEFREGQREVVEHVLAGEDVLAVLPTGAGKSLLFQLPAFLLEGATVAVSPLIALMKDQLDKLEERGLPAAILNSAQDQETQDRVLGQLARGQLKLLYVAPERFRSPRFRAALGRARISLFAVDEAHCVSEWGHDFRPDYLRLAEAAEGCGRPPILAVTATATENVRRDIAASLGLGSTGRPTRTFVRGFDRPNLRFSVETTSGDAAKLEAIVDALDSSPTGSAIVYCATRKTCERVGARLAKRKGGALVYHAGMPPEQRRRTQEAWSSGEVRTVVATNAFGLGIDKDDVRLVVHHDLPGSLEAYYQEAGRAGRDGLPSECRLVFAASDVRLQQFMIDGSYPERTIVESVHRILAARPDLAQDAAAVKERLAESASEKAVSSALRLLAEAGHAQADYDGLFAAKGDVKTPLAIDWGRLDRLREHEREKLDRVVAYARSHGCRRASILRYFGATDRNGETSLRSAAAGAEAPVAPKCGTCDRCRALGEDALPEAECATVVLKVLSMAARLKGRFGRTVAARLLAGDVQDEDRERGLASLPTIGALKPWTAESCAQAIDACLAEGLLLTRTEDGKYPKLVLTARGALVVTGRAPATIVLARPAEAKPARPGKPSKKGAAKPNKAPKPTTGPLPKEALVVYEALKTWRRAQAKELSIAPFIVCHDRTLEAIALRAPRDLAALAGVPGLGARKIERFGAGIVAAVVASAAVGAEAGGSEAAEPVS